MTDFIDVYKKQPEAEIPELEIDAEAIKDTPFQGSLPSGLYAPDLEFAHQNAAAWRLLRGKMSEEEYSKLRDDVVDKVGEFVEVEPEEEGGEK